MTRINAKLPHGINRAMPNFMIGNLCDKCSI